MNINCIVDVASREVSFQENYRIAAYDHNVDAIHFSIEPIEDFSLDTSSIKIAAQGPNKARHDYSVDPSTVAIEEETGYITFDWPIPAGVTEMPIGTFKYGDKGQLIFAVCAEIISGSTVSKAWHSDDGIITVVAHLEPESGGGEDPEEEATNRQMIGQLQTDVAVVQREVAAVAGGTPTVVDAKADMTEHDKIYVLSTDGKWYYYSTTAEDWLVGGTYGGAVTDTTLSISGAAADAKAVGEALAEKADSADVTALDTRVTAVEGDVSDLKEDLNDTQDWLGYPKNLFDARDLIVSGTNNWSIDSATKTSVTITHKNTFSTGYPVAILDLPSGDYIFHADYTNSATAFSLRTDGSWVKALTDGAEFTIDSAKENAIYFANDIVGTYKITEISVVAKEESSGKIHTLEDATSINTRKIADLEEGFNSIATPSIGPMDGTETQDRTIRANGDIYTAGSNNYRISRFSVSPGKTYWITATTNWGNALWCYYDSNDSVVEVGTVSASESDDTTITDRETTAPSGSAFLVIAYNPTVKNGAVKTQTGYTIVPQKTTGEISTIEANISALQASESATAQTVESLQTGFNSIVQPDISELVGEETLYNKAINASGTLITAGSDYYRVSRYPVTAGKKYWVTACANWGNVPWCIYNSSDTPLLTGTPSVRQSDFTIINNEEVTAPVNSAYIIIAYQTNEKQGSVKTQTGYKTAKWLGKKWVCVGDSLTAENIRTTKHYFDYVADETGITTLNMGVSGSGYARMADSNQAFYQRISSCPTDADVVTIFGSFNDLGAGLSIGSVDDTGTTTLAGCINTTIDNLQAVIPLVNLGIVAPTPWDTTQPTTSGQDYNYVEMLKGICERRSIPFLDLWRCSNLRPWDADFRAIAYSKDGGSGTHPDENGHKLVAPRFKAFLETLLM